MEFNIYLLLHPYYFDKPWATCCLKHPKKYLEKHGQTEFIKK